MYARFHVFGISLGVVHKLCDQLGVQKEAGAESYVTLVTVVSEAPRLGTDSLTAASKPNILPVFSTAQEFSDQKVA